MYVCVCALRAVAQSCLTVSPWTVARQTPLSMGFSRQEYWSGLPYPSPGDLPDPQIESVSLVTPPSMGFSRQEYWSELPYPSPGDLPDSGIEPTSLMSPALAGSFFTASATWEALLTETSMQ